MFFFLFMRREKSTKKEKQKGYDGSWRADLTLFKFLFFRRFFSLSKGVRSRALPAADTARRSTGKARRKQAAAQLQLCFAPG
jgi:hypothetical protein